MNHGDDHAGRRHAAPGESYASRPHPEYVVLDVGDGFGALIIHTGAGMHGAEIEVSPAGRDSSRQHKEVLERTIGGRPAFTAVFERLAEGAYTLWTDGAQRDRVAIRGGEIAELDWIEAG